MKIEEAYDAVIEELDRTRADYILRSEAARQRGLHDAADRARNRAFNAGHAATRLRRIKRELHPSEEK